MNLLSVSLALSVLDNVILQVKCGDRISSIGIFLGGKLIRSPARWSELYGISADPDFSARVCIYPERTPNTEGLFAGTWGPLRHTPMDGLFPCVWWEPNPTGAVLAFLEDPRYTPMGILEFNRHGILLWDYLAEPNHRRLETVFQLNSRGSIAFE